MSTDAVACHRCGFGFDRELLDDYYPGPNTGFVTCDKEGRVLASGRGVFELTGFAERDLIGRDVVEALGLTGFEADKNPVALSLEWGVRRLGEDIELTESRRAGEADHGRHLPGVRRGRRPPRRAVSRASARPRKRAGQCPPFHEARWSLTVQRDPLRQRGRARDEADQRVVRSHRRRRHLGAADPEEDRRSPCRRPASAGRSTSCRPVWQSRSGR